MAENDGAGNPVREHNVKIRSNDVTEGFRKAPARAMLRAVGMGDDDWVKPQIAGEVQAIAFRKCVRYLLENSLHCADAASSCEP